MGELGVDTELLAQTPAAVLCEDSTPRFEIAGRDEELVVWMMDLDCMRDMPRSEDGVVQAVSTFTRTMRIFQGRIFMDIPRRM
jgi:hypothetical protein